MKALIASAWIGAFLLPASAQPPAGIPLAPPPPPRSSFVITSDPWVDVYAKLTDRTVLMPAWGPKLSYVSPAEFLDKTNEAVARIESDLAQRGWEIVRDGEKFILLSPHGWWSNSAMAAQLAHAPRPSKGGDLVPPGYVNWPSATVDQALRIYADLRGRTVLQSGVLSYDRLAFRNQTALTRGELIYAINALLALNDFSVVDDGDKFVQVAPRQMVSLAKAHAPKPGKGDKLIQPGDIQSFTPTFRTAFAKPPPIPPTAMQKFNNKVKEIYTWTRNKLFGPPPPPPKPNADGLVAYFARLVGCKAEPAKQMGSLPITFEIKQPVTKAELLYAIETTLSLSGVAIIPVDKKTIRAGTFAELRKLEAKLPSATAKP